MIWTRPLLTLQSCNTVENGAASRNAILQAHWKWKGYIYAQMGQYEDALISLAQAEQLLPANPLHQNTPNP